MTKKDRVPVPVDTATRLMFSSDRTCCVCHRRGEPTQIHHINETPSDNRPENLAVLCLHCHDETQVRGGFGRKLDAAQVEHFRNDWHLRVEARREAADKIALAREAGHAQASAPTPTRQDALPDPSKLTNYILTLPAIRRDVYGRARQLWDLGGRQNMRQGIYMVTDVLEQILITLTSWYPRHHFNDSEPRDYINAVTASRFTWHRAHLEPHGVGTGGTSIGPWAASRVLDDLEAMALDMVTSLWMHLAQFDLDQWKQEWKEACEPAPTDARQNTRPDLGTELGEVVRSEDYAERILGRWLGPRKYVTYYADGRWGVQRNEDTPVEIDGRRWKIEGDKLSLTFLEDAGSVTTESTISSFRTKQFVTEDDGHKKTFDWAP